MILYILKFIHLDGYLDLKRYFKAGTVLNSLCIRASNFVLILLVLLKIAP